VAYGVTGAVEEVEAPIAEIVKGVEVPDLGAFREANFAQLAACKVAV
jgi:hypothetical protein